MENNKNTADQTRQAFLEAFCLLYSKKPVERITVQEVAKKAGYNRSTRKQSCRSVRYKVYICQCPVR